MLLKTIKIFIQNKFKELGITSFLYKMTIGFISMCLILSVIAFIGYLGMQSPTIIDILEFKIKLSSVKILLFLQYVFFGLCLLMSLVTAFAGFAIILGLIYFVIFVMSPGLYRMVPIWMEDFVKFIKKNWAWAKIVSGEDKRYLLFFKGVLNDFFIIDLGYKFAYLSKKEILKDLQNLWKSPWLYSQYFYRHNDLIEMFKDKKFAYMIKKDKIKKCEFIEFSKFYKENRRNGLRC